MASDLPIPHFKISLSEEELADLGRLSAAWSQVDFMLAVLIAFVTKTELKSMFLFLENATTGVRLAMLRKIAKDIPHEEGKAITKRICERLGKMIERRNHVVHGMWGYHHDGRKLSAACHNGRNPQSPVFAAELPNLYRSAVEITVAIGQLLARIEPNFKRGEATPSFYFGAAPPPDRATVGSYFDMT